MSDQPTEFPTQPNSQADGPGQHPDGELGEARLVETGTFRIDRHYALKTLSHFQLPDATQFILLWLRCAIASGATKMGMEVTEEDAFLGANKQTLDIWFDSPLEAARRAGSY